MGNIGRVVAHLNLTRIEDLAGGENHDQVEAPVSTPVEAKVQETQTVSV